MARRERTRGAGWERTLTAGLVVLLAGLAAGEAGAVPRYAARYGQRCTLCHIDPTGGGQRSAYAAQALVPRELSTFLLSEEQIAALDPGLGRSLSIGADLRTIYHRSDREPQAQSYENFLQMQSSVHLALQLSPRFVARVTQGQSGTREAYGLAYLLPWHGWLKAGRFVPNYGWRLADHTQVVREALGRSAPLDTDTGVELGVAPGSWQWTLSGTNGAAGSALDDDDELAWTSQVAWRGRIAGAGLAAGASLHGIDTPSGRRLDRGPFASVSAGRWTWLGECDWSGVDPDGAGGERTRWVASQELTMNAARGIDLRATWDFVDPDLDRKSGAWWRAGGGVEFLPYPFLALHAMVRREESIAPAPGRPAAPGIPRPDATWFELQFHLLY